VKIEAQLTEAFSVPIMLVDTDYGISASEMEYILNSEYDPNSGGNLTSTDRFILNNQELSGLKEFVDTAIDVYAKDLLQWVPENNLYVTQSWVNKNAKDTQHSPHTHPNSFVSGVFYLTDNPAPTVFSQRVNHMFPLDMPCVSENQYNQRFRKYQINPERKGQMILFPSSVEHFVPSNPDSSERMTLSFNTWAKGSAGTVQNITYLDLP
jgi:uncharacterized protein (TIGR02466 family)